MTEQEAYERLIHTGAESIEDGTGRWFWDRGILAYKDKFDHFRPDHKLTKPDSCANNGAN